MCIIYTNISREIFNPALINSQFENSIDANERSIEITDFEGNDRHFCLIVSSDDLWKTLGLHNCRLCTFNDGAMEREREREGRRHVRVPDEGCRMVASCISAMCRVVTTQNGNVNGGTTMQ